MLFALIHTYWTSLTTSFLTHSHINPLYDVGWNTVVFLNQEVKLRMFFIFLWKAGMCILISTDGQEKKNITEDADNIFFRRT